MVQPGHPFVVRDGEFAGELALFFLLPRHFLHLRSLRPLSRRQRLLGHQERHRGREHLAALLQGSQRVYGWVNDGRLRSLHLALVRFLSRTVGMRLSRLRSQVELLEIVEVVEQLEGTGMLTPGQGTEGSLFFGGG